MKEWKERGVGTLKFLRTKNDPKAKVRILMRRDKTLKICANHFSTFFFHNSFVVLQSMELKANVGSDRSWVYFTPADFADAEENNNQYKAETLAVRFQTVESLYFNF